MASKLTSCLAAVALAVTLAGCEVEKTEEGRAPDVDVQPGKMPEYNVEGPEVDVRRETREVTVPDVDVDVNREQKQMTVPNVDVTTPEEREPVTAPQPQN